VNPSQSYTDNRKVVDINRLCGWNNVIGNVLGAASWTPTAYKMSGSIAGYATSVIFRLGYPFMASNEYTAGLLPEGQASGCAPEYDADTTYAAYVAVVVAATNKVYGSLQGSNHGNAPATSPTYWEELNLYLTCGGFDANVPATIAIHRNYDYSGTPGQRTCDDTNDLCQGITGNDLPDSLYLAAKPAWFGSLTYPSVDPATPSVAEIPAAYFYRTGTWPDDVAAPDHRVPWMQIQGN
jgi:hypothetical protein